MILKGAAAGAQHGVGIVETRYTGIAVDQRSDGDIGLVHGEIRPFPMHIDAFIVVHAGDWCKLKLHDPANITNILKCKEISQFLICMGRTSIEKHGF